MSSDQWYTLAAVLLAAGALVLTVSQIALSRWLKRFRQE